jgi:hypothetical protein
MHRRPLVGLLVAACLVPFAAPAQSADPAQALRRHAGPGTVDWRSRTVTVVGEGVPPTGRPDAQTRLLTNRAAVADAYRRLAEATNGVQVTAGYVAGDLTKKNRVVHTRVEGLIKGAKPGEPVTHADGRVTVAMTMPLYGRQSLAWGLELGQLVKALARTAAPVVPPASRPSAPPPSSFGGGFWLAALAPFYLAEILPVTGVIIDAAGLGADPAMAPFVLGVGQRVYVSGKVAIDPARVVQEGITTYHEDLDEAKKDARTGPNPMIVTAKAVVGRPSTDILISDADAARLDQANQRTHILDQLKVSVVI